MNRKRKLTLQRVSRIGSLTSVEVIPVNVKFKGRPIGSLTIEAAIALYIHDASKRQDVFITKFRKTKHLHDSHSHNNHSHSSRSHDGHSHNSHSHSKHVHNSQPHTHSGHRVSYDMLDANRCAGFLLYSYDKNGAHSVLGENAAPGGYGRRTDGENFIMKA